MSRTFEVGETVWHVTNPRLKWAVCEVEMPTRWGYKFGLVRLERMTNKGELKRQCFLLTKANEQWMKERS